jgi:hypothetical protein
MAAARHLVRDAATKKPSRSEQHERSLGHRHSPFIAMLTASRKHPAAKSA